MVTPEMGDVDDGMIFGDRECSLNQDVFEPESSKVRKGRTDVVVCILVEIANVNGIVSGELREDVLVTECQLCVGWPSLSW